MSTFDFFTRINTVIDELHLEFNWCWLSERNEGMTLMLSELNTLYERGQFKRLMIQFQQSPPPKRIDPKWAKLKYLTGVYVDSTIQPGTSKALSSLLHLKLLIFGNTILYATKAKQFAQSLVNLEEIYIQIHSIHAISPFLRNSGRLTTIYVYGTGRDSQWKSKFK